MSDDANSNKKKFLQYNDNLSEIQNILNNLNEKEIEEFKQDISKLINSDNPEYDLELIIDQTINDSETLTELQTKLIVIIDNHLSKNKNLIKQQKNTEKIAKDINYLFKRLLKNAGEELDFDLLRDKGGNYALNLKARKDIQRSIKNFIIYKIYQIQNPRRIAGETIRDNYIHNLIERGEEVANQYEGGRKGDLQKYTTKDIKYIKSHARNLRTQRQSNSGRGR